MNYRDRLIADGVDCREGMIHVREEHLHFMTSVHRRTLIQISTVFPWRGGSSNSDPVERVDNDWDVW